ncbi:DUF6350 family protein [Phycicoccus endophyticus]|uniref:cell division protein PerM n=1 Tax=Phycicoccus endophyticus TaxID=1690220 RepID=UPI001CB6E9E9|nr:DUF6350 family protein [Phycicoccus endophyticus]
MTVVDRLRSALPGATTADEGGPSFWAPGWRRSALLGVATGTVSLLLVLVPVLLAWNGDSRTSAGLGGALDVGSSLWLLAGGARLGSGAATIALTPLLATGVLVLLARVGAREGMVRVSTDGPYWAGLVPRPLATAAASWWAGYAAVVAVAWLLARDGVLPPHPATLLLPGLVVPVAGLVLALRPVAREDPDVLGPRARLPLPDLVRRAVGPGLAGAGLLVLLGALVVAGAVVLQWPRVSAVQAELGAEGAGAAVLFGGQAAGLANLGLWVVSFVAGPGFSVVQGASVTWDGVESGLLPMLPVLAALPQPGRFPGLVALACVLVVVACGAWVGHRAVRRLARLARLRSKLAVALSACATAALALGALDVLGGGSLGQFRLSSVGAPAGRLVLAVFAELALGAVCYVLRDAWRLRR